MKHILSLNEYLEHNIETKSILDILKIVYKTKNIKKIGSGEFGVVFSIKDLIIKVTGSYISANSMSFIKNNPHPNIIKVFNVYKLNSHNDVVISDSFFNYNEFYLESYPLYIIEMEDLEKISKSEYKNIDFDLLSDITTDLGMYNTDLHYNNIMKRKSDGEIVIIDIMADNLDKQKIDQIYI